MPRKAELRFLPSAEVDLFDLYRFIAAEAGRRRAEMYIERIQAACRALEVFPERGTRRDDLGAGMRTLGFEGRATIAFRTDGAQVEIVRILYGGRDLGRAFDNDG
jgi:toxin ParE1/3/4